MTTPTGVTFILDSTPRVRFYFPEGTDLRDYSFRAEGAEVPFNETGETVGDSKFVCADISLFAYKMIGTLEVYKSGEKCGSFHINSYLDFALTQNDTALVGIVERFYAYCKSALDYRKEIVLANQG